MWSCNSIHREIIHCAATVYCMGSFHSFQQAAVRRAYEGMHIASGQTCWTDCFVSSSPGVPEFVPGKLGCLLLTAFIIILAHFLVDCLLPLLLLLCSGKLPSKGTALFQQPCPADMPRSRFVHVW